MSKLDLEFVLTRVLPKNLDNICCNDSFLNPGSDIRPGGPHVGRVGCREGGRRRERNPVRARGSLEQVGHSGGSQEDTKVLQN